MIAFQLHIKIQQDLQGLVGSMTNMFKSHSKQGSSPNAGPFEFKMPEILPQAEGKPPVIKILSLKLFPSTCARAVLIRCDPRSLGGKSM